MKTKLLSCKHYRHLHLSSQMPPRSITLMFLKFLDDIADVDFEIGLTDTQANPSDSVGGSISLSMSFVGNGLIYVDDEAISE